MEPPHLIHPWFRSSLDISSRDSVSSADDSAVPDDDGPDEVFEAAACRSPFLLRPWPLSPSLLWSPGWFWPLFPVSPASSPEANLFQFPPHANFLHSPLSPFLPATVRDPARDCPDGSFVAKLEEAFGVLPSGQLQVLSEEQRRERVRAMAQLKPEQYHQVRRYLLRKISSFKEDLRARPTWTRGDLDLADPDGQRCSSSSSSSSCDPSTHQGPVQLWQFLLDLLTDRSRQDCISWTGQHPWEFRLNDPDQVAKLWGAKKNKPKMNYEKLSRGLRYYYEKHLIYKTNGQRYVYRFVTDLQDILGYSYLDLQALVRSQD